VKTLRHSIATVLSILTAATPVWPQEVSQAPVRPQAPVIVRPYRPVTVPDIHVANSPRLKELIRAGKLYLTAQDAIRIALENNIDIEIARYNQFALEWNVERASAGGALPGVPSTSSQAFSVASGQGVQGSQSAAGVSTGAPSSGGGAGTNASISQVGPVTQTLDPALSQTTTFGHQSTPQQNTTQSLVSNLISNTRGFSGSYQQGFLTGGAITTSFKDTYLSQNSPTNVLNPSSATVLSVSGQHNLLRGFGVDVNARTINVAKANLAASDLNFETQVTGIVANVLNAYNGLVADFEDLHAKIVALDVARQFLEDTQKQLEFGSLTPLDVTNANTQYVAARQNADLSGATLRQQEIQVKSLLSRTRIGDSELAAVEIVPLDRITIPEKDDLPPLRELVDRALAKRTDLASEKVSLENSRINALGTRNGILPSAGVFGTMSNAGLSGAPQPLHYGPYVLEPDPYFVGGIGTALGQVFRRNFPSESGGAFYSGSIRNNQAQADYGIDQLQMRQSELLLQKDRNQAQVDVLNAVIALRQARAKYEAAVRNRILNEDLLKAEREKYSLGSSTPYLVIQQQRDFVNSGSAELAALVDYSNARVALDQATGQTLVANHIALVNVRAGKLPGESKIPDTKK
jgi:outer membrane protein TolC